MIRRAFGGVACATLLLATSLVQAEVSVREDEESFRFVKDGVVFAEMARPDAREVALTVSCADEFVRLELAPSPGAARTVRTLALPEIRLTERLHAARTLGSGGLKELGEDKGSYTFLAVAEPVTRRGVVAAFLTGRKGSGILFSSMTNGCAAIRPEIQYGRLTLDAGEATVGETLLIGAFDDCRLGLERYADEVARAYQIKLNPQIAGYCTWYADRHGAAGDEASTAAFAEMSAKKLVPWGLDFFQIDSDWQAGVNTNMMCRDFRRVNPKGPYSNGLERTTATLKAHGLKPGLWFMPFCGSQLDSAYSDKQDLFVRSRIATKRPDGVDWQCAVMDNEVGRPYECIWGGTVLDYTNPKTHDYLRELVTRFRDKWGFSYFKCDALWGAVATQHMYPSDEYRPDDLGEQLFHDPKATNMENARRGLEALRAIAGKDVFLLGCNLSQSMRPMVASYGVFDAMRVGPDNSSKWDGIKAGPIRGTSRYFLNGRVWYNDPDPVYVRDSIPDAHARVSATWTALSGGLFAFSDWLGDLSDARVDILRRTLAPHRLYTKVRPVDLFESDLANTWLLADGDACVFGFFNWDETKPLVIAYDAAYAGLDPEKTYVGFDFWANRFVAPFRGKVETEVGAGDTKVWQLREFDGTRPVLVSTSRHVASPLFEVTGEKWDADARTLSGTSQVVANDPYELRIVLPEGMGVAAAAIGGAKAEIKTEGRTARIRAIPVEGGAVKWQIKTIIRTSDAIAEVQWETLPRYCRSNIGLVKGSVKGIVVEHHWLGCTDFKADEVKAYEEFAARGIVRIRPHYSPWAWMNDYAVRLTDALVSVVKRHYGLGEDAVIVSTGLSMGGQGCLVWPRYSRHRVAAVVANCPVTDLVYHYAERPDLPRTICCAFADAPDLQAAIAAHSPVHLVKALPDIPYFIVHSTADIAVSKERHTDRFVAAMRAAGRKVEYVVSEGTGHCQLTPEAQTRYDAALLAPFSGLREE